MNEEQYLPTSSTVIDQRNPAFIMRTPTDSDRLAIVEMHARCSLTSRARRWLAPLAEIPAEYLSDALRGRAGHTAVLATLRAHQDYVVGLASAHCGGGHLWELGVLVEDEFQGQAIGSALVDHLIQGLAVTEGISIHFDLSFENSHWTNAHMGRYGKFTSIKTEDSVTHSILQLSGRSTLNLN